MEKRLEEGREAAQFLRSFVVQGALSVALPSSSLVPTERVASLASVAVRGFPLLLSATPVDVPWQLVSSHWLLPAVCPNPAAEMNERGNFQLALGQEHDGMEAEVPGTNGGCSSGGNKKE